MIQCGTHDDYDDPPHVPMITGILPKRPKKDSITDALTAAATAVVKHLVRHLGLKLKRQGLKCQAWQELACPLGSLLNLG